MKNSLDDHLGKIGMEVLGRFEIGENELPDVQPNDPPQFGLMIASAGRAMWPVFENSVEATDGLQNPLERWSARVLGSIASNIGAQLRLPFERPYLPMQQWASSAAGLKRSPLGLLIHREYGLWFGLRGVLLFCEDDHNSALDYLPEHSKPNVDICDDCIEKPCLSACPVSAFSTGKLVVKTCFSHIDSTASPNFMREGCHARDACPVGEDFKYDNKQLRFHMHAFRHNIKIGKPK